MKKTFKIFTKKYKDHLKEWNAVTCSKKFLDKRCDENNSLALELDFNYKKATKAEQEAFITFVDILSKLKKKYPNLIVSDDPKTKELGEVLNRVVWTSAVFGRKINPLIADYFMEHFKKHFLIKAKQIMAKRDKL